jgi:hypothetical protein
MNIAVGGLQMAPAQEIVITIVFQIFVSTLHWSFLVTLVAVLAGVVKFRGPDHPLGCTHYVSFLPDWLRRAGLPFGWMYTVDFIFGLGPDVLLTLCGFSSNAAHKKVQYCSQYNQSFHLGCFNTFGDQIKCLRHQPLICNCNRNFSLFRVR